ncbi:MAG TPA: dienelactone hydrolase family protein [Candidatus Limnocylindria bacterium]|nr:dienelactone hydrolase family protein [Candidatus Limnocylindria bacterium]
MRAHFIAVAVFVLFGCASSAPSPEATSATNAGRSIPPGETAAKAALDKSPRHGEFVDVPFASGSTPIRTWVVYPERKDKAGVVVVIHEIYGLSDWIRSVADQLAADGLIAVAPDLISGLGPGGGGTDSVASRDDVVGLVRGLSPEATAARLDAVRRYAAGIPAGNGKFATIGFCWGGARSFEYAAADPSPQASVVFYGTSPDSATLLRVRAPVLGLYGADDARVNATIEPAKTALSKLGRSYETHVFEGAGHGFLRGQAERNGANLRAAEQAWPRVLEFLRQHLGS